MTQDLGKDKARRIKYPSTPDSRGKARVHHLRRPYYLGPHDSPLSYVMFGLWKQQLEETGHAPRGKELRPLAEKLLGEPVVVKRPVKWPKIWLGSAIVFACIGVAAAANFHSTPPPPVVDGKVLSEKEFIFVRSIRRAELRRLEADPNSTRMGVIAEDLYRQLDEGKIVEPLHRKLLSR